MATLEQRLVELAQAIGTDVKDGMLKRGDLSALSTTAKSNIVAAVNEVFTMAQSAGAGLIDDGVNSSAKTFSSNKIESDLTLAINTLRSELRAGAGAALDTFSELATALGNDPTFAATISTALGNRVRVDAVQTFTAPQRLQARQNIDALGSVELGNHEVDLAAAYATSKA